MAASNSEYDIGLELLCYCVCFQPCNGWTCVRNDVCLHLRMDVSLISKDYSQLCSLLLVRWLIVTGHCSFSSGVFTATGRPLACQVSCFLCWWTSAGRSRWTFVHHRCYRGTCSVVLTRSRILICKHLHAYICKHLFFPTHPTICVAEYEPEA